MARTHSQDIEMTRSTTSVVIDSRLMVWARRRGLGLSRVLEDALKAMQEKETVAGGQQ